MPKYALIGLIVVILTFLIMNYWPKLKDSTKNKIVASIFGIIVVVGTFMIMNYWPKLKEQTKSRILMVIFGLFFLSIFVLLYLLMF